MRDPFLADLN